MTAKSLLIVGAGLTGLYASILAARRGASVRLIAEGRGGLALSHGCIDIWRDGDLRFSIGRLERGHPLRQAGLASIETALAAFLDLMHEAPLAYVGGMGRIWRLPTALGAAHTTAGVPVSLAGTTGVHDWQGALKLLLAGADVAMVASAPLSRGPEVVRELVDGLRDWMVEREYTSVEQLKGSLSQASCPDPAAFERGNYMRALVSYAPHPALGPATGPDRGAGR